MFVFLFPDTSVLWGPAWIEIMLWIVVTAGLAFLLYRDQQAEEYLLLWRRNGLPALFILLAFVSILWSINPVVTLFRGLELLFATLTAAYIGLRYRPEQFMEILFWFGACLFILSITLVFSAPRTGTMYWEPFNGAWRGFFWHRNHLASITALLSAVYLCRILPALPARNRNVFLDGFFYLVCWVILYFADSATGYIVFLVLHGFVFFVWAWLKISHRLQWTHYALISGSGLLLSVLVLFNLDFVFGVFNRDTTLTGRLTLWKNELQLASQHLWLGRGFGAAWATDPFREEIRLLAGWASQPLIGDNGYLDMLLHLGILGLGVLVLVLFAATVRSLRFALDRKTLPAFFPLLVMIYAFFANITFSMLAETEVFLWSLIVVVLFMTISPTNKTAGR
jgi:O-antigen ligase